MSLKTILTDLLLPPSNLAWFALLALLIPWRLHARRRPGLPFGRGLALLFLVPLVALSTPFAGKALLHSLAVPPVPEADPRPGAIVVLSAEAILGQYGRTMDVGPMTLERERGGALLQRETGLPLLVTGGIVNGPIPLGDLMAVSMTQDFGLPVRWVESRSLTTWENAQFSVPILRAAGISKIYLVTHSWHMRRSILSFEHAGIEVVPAPVGIDPAPNRDLDELIPRVSGWIHSYYALHEWMGLLAYRLRQ